MLKETPTKEPGIANGPTNNQSHLSPSSTHNDLSETPSKTNGDAATSMKANTVSTPTASPNNSPTKSSPSKSKNKKRNDAKRRSANIKRRQQQEESSTSRSDKTELADGLLEKRHQLNDNPQSTRNSQTPSPKTVNKQRQSNQAGQMDPKSSTLNEQQSNHAKAASGESDQATSTSANQSNNTNDNGQQKPDTNSWRRRQQQHENRELREQLKLRDAQLQNLADRVKQQINKTKELESSLISTTRTCGQFEKLLQQELTNRSKLETENEALNQTVTRLKNQISVHEKERSANNELIRVLNATLMERETEVSILKLKMTRMQTNSSNASMSQFNPPSSSSIARNEPQKAFTMAGRSNSEFTRNSTARSTMVADVINTKSSNSRSQQYLDDRDAQVWANVPEELTPSRRPVLLERNLPGLYEQCHNISANLSNPLGNQSSTPILRDRRYRTLPRSMKNSVQQNDCDANESSMLQVNAQTDTKDPRDSPVKQPTHYLVTNLDESNNTTQSSGNKSSTEANSNPDSETKSTLEEEHPGLPLASPSGLAKTKHPVDEHDKVEENHNNKASPDNTNYYSAINETEPQSTDCSNIVLEKTQRPPNLAPKSPSTPVKLSGLKKLLGKFKRSDSSSSESQSKSDLRSQPSTPTTSAFQRGATRSTLVGPPSTFRAQMSPMKAINFQTDKPFADWNTDMLVDWLTMIGLSMYANQCRRWVECGAHIMNATPAEVDKGLGITNHLHRKKLRLAISELNGDCDKITKAAAKLDYLWVARWLDDIGVPQYKEAFINARVDGRVLNYLTVEDLVSLGVKSLLHHSSIRCGIRVLRSINFNLQLLKRRATAEEIEQMNSIRERMDVQSEPLSNDKTNADAKVNAHDETDVPLWTCHRVMEWLRMIDFAEFAPNLRGSGVHGGLIMYEDGFNVDTMSTLLSIPTSRTLLRRHLSTFFENLIGRELAQRKMQYKELPSNQQLNPTSEIKNPKKSPWFAKLKSSKVGQDGMDEYLCPMYPVEPQIIKSPTRKSESSRREGSTLPRIPESVNV